MTSQTGNELLTARSVTIHRVDVISQQAHQGIGAIGRHFGLDIRLELDFLRFEADDAITTR